MSWPSIVCVGSTAVFARAWAGPAGATRRARTQCKTGMRAAANDQFSTVQKTILAGLGIWGWIARRRRSSLRYRCRTPEGVSRRYQLRLYRHAQARSFAPVKIHHQNDQKSTRNTTARAAIASTSATVVNRAAPRPNPPPEVPGPNTTWLRPPGACKARFVPRQCSGAVTVKLTAKCSQYGQSG
jgi:hypothetical protein